MNIIIYHFIIIKLSFDVSRREIINTQTLCKYLYFLIRNQNQFS